MYEFYVEKIERIIDNSDICDSDFALACSSKIKAWLLCEWQCDAIPDMALYNQLVGDVDNIIRLHGYYL